MKLEYVLITAAHNEQAFIEKTILSVLAQTILPKKWIIVNDGSTDHTDEIVQEYTDGRDWMSLFSMPGRAERHFAGKAKAFNAGYAMLQDLTYDVIGNLDADISFGEDHIEYLLSKFASMPELGVAGTHYTEGEFHSFRDSYINVHHVNGQLQLFRKQCLRQIGGYLPIKAGGIDWVAVTTARMLGWTTYSFGERTFMHHRRMGTADSNTLRARFHYGKKDYLFGGHPLWQLFRGCFQMTKKPYIVGGIFLLLGYFCTWLTHVKRPIPEELVQFNRKEQIQRIKELLNHRLTSRTR